MADRTSTVRVVVDATSSKASSALGRFGKVAGLAALGVAGIGIALGTGIPALYDYADASDDANARIENVTKQMGLFGKQASVVSARIEDVAKKTAIATATDINSIEATQAKLLTFKELAKTADQVGGNFDRATQAAVDLAATGFGTAETNAVQLGKALNDPIKGLTALGRAGITFTDQEKARIQTLVESNKMGEAQAMVLKAIETQVGGTAAATAGGFEQMRTAASIFSQELATKALPYLDAFGTFMLETGTPAVKEFAAAFAERAQPVLQAYGQYVQERILPALKQFGGFLRENVVPALGKLANFIAEKVIPAYSEFVGWVLDNVVPAVKNILVPAIEGGREAFNSIRQSIAKNAPELKDMGDKVKAVAEFLLQKLAPVIGQYTKTTLPLLGTAIGTAITVIAKLYDAFVGIYNKVQDVIDKVHELISAIQSIPGVPGGGGSGQKGPTTGGSAPTAGRSSTVIFNGPVTDPRATATALKNVLRRQDVSTGMTVAG